MSRMGTHEDLAEMVREASGFVEESDKLRLAAVQLAIALAADGEDSKPVDTIDNRTAGWTRNIEYDPEDDLTDREARFLEAAKTIVGLQFGAMRDSILASPIMRTQPNPQKGFRRGRKNG